MIKSRNVLEFGTYAEIVNDKTTDEIIAEKYKRIINGIVDVIRKADSKSAQLCMGLSMFLMVGAQLGLQYPEFPKDCENKFTDSVKFLWLEYPQHVVKYDG